jgi:hypothetical protein
MKTRNLLVLVLVLATILIAAVPAGACDCPPPPPPPCGDEGCTPGYWKNHKDAWMGYSPNDYFDDVFGVGPDMKLINALSAKKKDVGSGPEAALIRHAVAALLNAAHPDVAYAETEAGVIGMVQDAYSSGDFEGIKDQLESWNEAGCPLN